MADQSAPNQNTAARPRPAPRPVQQKSGGMAGLIIGIVGIVLAIAAGAYAWMNSNAAEQETAELRSKVKMLENRADHTENAIVQILSDDEILPATSADDANIVINKNGQKPQRSHAAPHKKSSTSRATAHPKTKAVTKAVKQKRATRSVRNSKASNSTNTEAVPETFGRTYTPPAHVHYAVFMDSFGDSRTANITKASFAVRYGAYVRKVGARYNVYAGWYRDINDARRTLRLLATEYGPSCRIETLYH